MLKISHFLPGIFFPYTILIPINSAGKSTLLNTMFGTQFRCGDGMCTRGINMQLVKSKYSSSYDYILVLDTEGLRAPEFAGRKLRLG